MIVPERVAPLVTQERNIVKIHQRGCSGNRV